MFLFETQVFTLFLKVSAVRLENKSQIDNLHNIKVRPILPSENESPTPD